MGIGYLVAKKIDEAKYNIFVEQAKARAKAIEHEAELVLKDAKNHILNAELEIKKKYEDKSHKVQKEYNQKIEELSKKEQKIKAYESEIEKSKEELDKSKSKAVNLYNENLRLKDSYNTKLDELIRVLEHSSGLTQNEAREIILKKVEEKSRDEISHIVRKYEEEAKSEAKRKANYIIAQATSRFAGEFAAERLINVINIKNDELKGRIIGKEGRNVKTLEMLLGVDIIIDDTPEAVVISGFDPLRREVARLALEKLIDDGI